MPSSPPIIRPPSYTTSAPVPYSLTHFLPHPPLFCCTADRFAMVSRRDGVQRRVPRPVRSDRSGCPMSRSTRPEASSWSWRTLTMPNSWPPRTIGKWASEGIEINYVLCTAGDKGSSDPKMTPVEARRDPQAGAARGLQPSRREGARLPRLRGRRPSEHARAPTRHRARDSAIQAGRRGLPGSDDALVGPGLHQPSGPPGGRRRGHGLGLSVRPRSRWSSRSCSARGSSRTRSRKCTSAAPARPDVFVDIEKLDPSQGRRAQGPRQPGRRRPATRTARAGIWRR